MKLHLRNFCRAFYKDERGQSTTEYILILSVVVMIAMKFKTTFSSQLGGLIGNLGQQLDTAQQNAAQ
ncbi:MAG: hypothetical protein P4M08_08460 [Oligoflexia bacterium]|nr:hypothetical protein [Oligoflexia bacterium]